MNALRIAVIGSGISGLSAAWLLSQRHIVTVFEAENRIGGHSHTVDVNLRNGKTLPIDTGFIVSNSWTYPNFMALMDYLDVDMISTKMSFSVSMAETGYEYSGEHLGTLLGRGRQWLSLEQWRLVADLVRFYRTVEPRVKEFSDQLTLGEFLTREKYSETFINKHILPLAGAIWSMGNDAIAAYPLKAFLKFFSNHKLFMLGDRPDWNTVKGGSRVYVERLIEDGKFSFRTGSPVVRVLRHASSVDLVIASGVTENFDHVVIATHGDQALQLLDTPSSQENDLLRVFKTSRNLAVLHRDSALMPKHKRHWAAWNYLGRQSKDEQVAVTYWMNSLQKLESDEQHFVTLNPHVMPRAETIDREMIYRHPIFTPETFGAQKELWSLQGQNHTWFAGAWFGAGFHEDGLQAGLAVAEALGAVTRPWNVADPSGRIYLKPDQPSHDKRLAKAAE